MVGKTKLLSMIDLYKESPVFVTDTNGTAKEIAYVESAYFERDADGNIHRLYDLTTLHDRVEVGIFIVPIK